MLSYLISLKSSCFLKIYQEIPKRKEVDFI
ncbi:MAG: hypothetical protein UX75_C0007G0035 [Candidatus Moranbacteria bacterium GW2011_GWE2_47_10]|nr:MAG: hypothetical protein UX75_C0007G0035 [Candidatus Moranbacteria bacterium GW2011_GWE2_47_10]